MGSSKTILVLDAVALLLMGTWAGCGSPTAWEQGDSGATFLASSSSSGASSGSGGTETFCARTDCSGVCVDTETDATNCGSCGRDCRGSPCTKSQCEPVALVSEPGHLTTLALGAVNVYWGHTEDDALMKVPIEGGPPSSVAAGAPDPLNYIAETTLGATSIFWIRRQRMLDGESSILKAPLQGGSPQTLLSTDEYRPWALSVDATHVYWAGTLAGERTLMKAPIGGGDPIPLAATPTISLSRTVAGATGVYWVAYQDGTYRVMKIPPEGGSPTVVSVEDRPGFVRDFAVGPTHVAWVHNSTGVDVVGTVMKAPIEGGAPILLASGQYRPNSITMDATHVYWTNERWKLGEIMKVPLEGGEPITLASFQNRPNNVAVNATHVYWCNHYYYDESGTDTIMKVAK